ncbi:unnamed protein product [Adineta steineri]|uniref:G-protein coupled receptors family 1 profile domain-containing protein n=1 Tax=Adineta steineri TaxID=433720 RepID=A0A816B429_9BILA|nr:unnamed protein product [Adineta steineri]CAF1604425.1 unnamed protein product [Adineta steineri]
MDSTEQTINSSSFIITVYVGYFTIITGLIGHIINILVFTQLKTFRKNQSAFYLTVGSFVDCWQLIFATTTRTVASTVGYDPTKTSLAWCKLRTYLSISGSVVLTINQCFSAIDQYLSTNHYPRLRQISTYKLAQRAVSGLLIYAIIYDIPFLIFEDIQIICATFNPGFNYFFSFIHFCLINGFVPIFISSLFSFLAYQNVRRLVQRHIALVRRRLDQQLTAMILVRVALFAITTIPYICFRIYQINNPVDQTNEFAVAVDQLIRSCFNAVYTMNNSGGFYVYYATSARFRRQVRRALFQKNLCKCITKKVTKIKVAHGIPPVQAIKPAILN